MNKISLSLLGWYSIFTFRIEEGIKPDELKWSLKDDENVVLILLDIHFYKDRELDFLALKNLKEILCFFYEHKKTILFRPTYDTKGNVNLTEPDDFNLVKKHLAQILGATEHIFVFQGLLVGNWAEMHGGKYCEEKNIKELYSIFLNYHKTYYIAVRKPCMYRYLGKSSKITIFDDGIFGSSTDLGTFGLKPKGCSHFLDAWIRKDELQFIYEECAEKPVGGEIVFSEENHSPSYFIEQCEKMHLAYLNKHHDLKILELLKRIPYEKSSLYAYIDSHIGSRFIIRKKKGPAGLFRHNYLFSIQNIGFARNFEPVSIEVYSKDKMVFQCEMFLNSKEEEEFSFSVPIKNDFTIYLKRKNHEVLLSLGKDDFS